METGKVVERHEVVVQEDEFGYNHTFPCPVCRKKHAILNVGEGVFEPCYECASLGWLLINVRNLRWWQLWKMWRYFKDSVRTATANARLFYQQGS